MQNSVIKITSKQGQRLLATALTALVAGLGAFGTHAAVNYVITDPANSFNGYENVYTNGLTTVTGPTYISQYLGAISAGASLPNDSSVDLSGNVTIGADDYVDVTPPYNTDPLLWENGTGAAISDVLSDIYCEFDGASAGDSVIFVGALVTNALVTPYSNNVVLFIKDYDASWGLHSFITTHINTLTNGQQFALTMPSAYATGDHIQYGLEWSGPPVRSVDVANYGSAVISTNGGVVAPPPPPKNVNLYIDPSQAWAGYRNVIDQFGANYGPASGYIGVGGQTPDFQGTISSQGVVRCAPDISLDVYFHTDLNIWADTTGTNPAVATYDNTFYVDSLSTGANGGDTVIFSGTMVTNALVDAGMANSLVAFIKDFSSGWAYYGETTVPLSSLANGQQFSISKTISTTGDHVQWGFEWQGTPYHTNSANPDTYVGNEGYVLFSSNSVVAPGPQIISINPGSADILIGSNITVAVNASGTGLSYQWAKNGAKLTDGIGISGSATSALTLTNVQPSEEGTFNVIVTDSSSLSVTGAVSLVVVNPGWLYFDRALAPFTGYINVWNGTNLISTPPPSGAAGTTPKSSFGFAVAPTSLLRATMNVSNDVVTLQPNTYVYDGATNSMDATYINQDGSSAAYLEQDYYIDNDNLAGDTLTFAGYCASNSLDPKYTVRAWIKDGSPDWSVEHRYDAPIVAGKPYSLTVATTAGDHIQYGFGVWGPDNSATNPITQGVAVIKVYSSISSVSGSGASVNLAFPTVVNHSYAVQYKTNLTDNSWNTLTTTNGIGVNVVLPDSTTAASRRFYRLSTQ